VTPLSDQIYAAIAEAEAAATYKKGKKGQYVSESDNVYLLKKMMENVGLTKPTVKSLRQLYQAGEDGRKQAIEVLKSFISPEDEKAFATGLFIISARGYRSSKDKYPVPRTHVYRLMKAYDPKAYKAMADDIYLQAVDAMYHGVGGANAKKMKPYLSDPLDNKGPLTNIAVNVKSSTHPSVRAKYEANKAAVDVVYNIGRLSRILSDFAYTRTPYEAGAVLLDFLRYAETGRFRRGAYLKKYLAGE
jgi:hypothetical protein